jgi:hypothetical protein
MQNQREQVGLMDFDALVEHALKIANRKEDLIVPGTKFKVRPEGVIEFGQSGSFKVAPTGHETIRNKLGIPSSFYERLLSDHPDLWADTVGKLVNRTDRNYMVRTLDGDIRAVLSDSYSRIDNDSILRKILPTFKKLQDENGMRFADAGMTPDWMRIKIIFPRIEGEVKAGDVIQSGIMISNSEIGKGAAMVSGYLNRLVCMNGMVANQMVRRVHLGERIAGDEYFTLRTNHRRELATTSEMSDVIVGMATDRKWFDTEIEKMRGAAEDIAFSEIQEIPAKTQKQIGLSDEETLRMSRHLFANSGDVVNRWDVGNAVTRLAQDVGNYNRRIELEESGASLILNAKGWKRIR